MNQQMFLTKTNYTNLQASVQVTLV